MAGSERGEAGLGAFLDVDIEVESARDLRPLVTTLGADVVITGYPTEG